MDPIGIVIKINPTNPRWKHIFDFKSKRMIFHEVDGLEVGDFFHFETNAKIDFGRITFELGEHGELKTLKSIPVVIHPRGRHDIPAWSPIVGVVSNLLPAYKDLQHVVVEVTLDWIPFDECWCLSANECYKTEIDPEVFIVDAPFVRPPPTPAVPPRKQAVSPPVTPEEEQKLLRKGSKWNPQKDKGHAIVFRIQDGALVAWCGELKGTVELNMSSRNCGPAPAVVGSFLNIFISPETSVRGFPIVKEFLVVAPELEHTIIPDKSGQRRLRVKTRIAWQGKFDVVGGSKIYYGCSSFFGKCYDTYDLPSTKISVRTRGKLEVEITDTPHKEQLMFQIMNVRHIDPSTRPPKMTEKPKEEVHPLLAAQEKPQSLTGFITQCKMRRNTVFCLQTGSEFYFQDQSRMWTGLFIKFLINANRIEPYQIEEVKKPIVERRWTPDLRPELYVRCSFEGRTTPEGYAILRSPDLSAEVVDRFNSTYLESDFKCWVYRQHEPTPRWVVSDYVPTTAATSSCNQKKTALVYTGKKSDGIPQLYSHEMGVFVNDPDKITVKPGMYRRWILQEGTSPWRLALMEQPCEPEEEYEVADCAEIAFEEEANRKRQQKAQEAVAAIRHLAQLAPIQDCVMSLNLDPRKLARLEELLFGA